MFKKLKIKNIRSHRFAFIFGIILIPFFFVNLVKIAATVFDENTYFSDCSLLDSYICYSWIFEDLNSGNMEGSEYFLIILFHILAFITFYLLVKIFEFIKEGNKK